MTDQSTAPDVRYPPFSLRFEYEASRQIHNACPPFYALIMAAMRGADEENLRRLKLGFPDVWDELEARYHAPGGLLAGETP